jgi:hypothetical protein
LLSYKAIVEFLDKSRSALSRTRTTSSAPAPALTPATIAIATTCEAIIEDLHSEQGNPNNLRYLNARDETSLRNLANETVPSLVGKQKVLMQYISDAENKRIHVSPKVINLWSEKKAAAELWLPVLRDASQSNAALDDDAKAKISEFFSVARDAWEVALSNSLIKLSKEIIGPYALGACAAHSCTVSLADLLCPGDQFSIADLHLASWITRVIKLAGGTREDDGRTAVAKLESYIGNGFVLPKDSMVTDADSQQRYQSKLGAFWDALKERPSWQKVYGKGLY